MSAAVIMLAIVVLWAVVLVPLWLRRDGAEPVPADEIPPEEILYEEPVHTPAQPYAEARRRPPPVEKRPEKRPIEKRAAAERAAERRAAEGRVTEPAVETAWRPSAQVLARRRNRFLLCVLGAAVTTGLAIAQIIPWWGAIPAPVLLLGYLSVLRAAVRADAERRDEFLRARAEHAERRREKGRMRREAAELRKREAAEERKAKVIQLDAHLPDQPYDQHTDIGKRAVGD